MDATLVLEGRLDITFLKPRLDFHTEFPFQKIIDEILHYLGYFLNASYWQFRKKRVPSPRFSDMISGS